jgi:hypothetical protein
MKQDPINKLILAYIAMVLAFLIFVILTGLSSCQVLKGKRVVTSDSTKVSRVDSGTVRVNTNDKKDSLAWWREILNFSRDTTIVTPGVTNVYPTSYIREGGVQVIKEKETNYDSLWNNRLDSLSMRFSELSKSKETEVATQWYIWVILGCVGLIAIKQLVPFKIVKS